MEKNITSQQESLTPEQKKLVEDNAEAVYRSLLRRTKRRNWMLGANRVYPEEALSYLVDVVKEYDPTKNTDFVGYAVNRCLNRLKDEYRRLNRHIRISCAKIPIVDSIKNRLLVSKGYCSESEVSEEIQKIGLDPDKFKNVTKHKKVNMEDVLDRSLYCDGGMEEIEWNNFKNQLIAKSEKHFVEYDDEGDEKKSNNLSAKVHKILIREYILPKCDGAEHKTLAQIANETNLSEGRLSQLIRGKKMKNFIKLCYGNLV